MTAEGCLKGGELHAPTIARVVPAEIDLALGQLLSYERLAIEGNLAYV